MASGAPTRAKDEELSKRETDLVASLRALIEDEVLHASGMKERAEEASQELGHWQFVFIMALALDLALFLVYLLTLFPDLEQNRVVSFIVKLLPFVGGTLLVTYLDNVRVGIIKLTSKKSFRWSCVAAFPLLLAFQIPLYSLFVDLHPADAHVQIMDKGKYQDAELRHSAHGVYLPSLTPSRYTIKVQNEWSVYEVSAWQVFKGTLARLPVLNHYIRPLRMDALNEVIINSPKDEGSLTVVAADTPGMRISNLNRGAAVSPGIYRWLTQFSNDISPSVHLPAGHYNFELKIKDCPPLLMGGESTPRATLDFQPDFQRLCDKSNGL